MTIAIIHVVLFLRLIVNSASLSEVLDSTAASFPAIAFLGFMVAVHSLARCYFLAGDIALLREADDLERERLVFRLDMLDLLLFVVAAMLFALSIRSLGELS